jgi:hypothetical protein
MQKELFSERLFGLGDCVKSLLNRSLGRSGNDSVWWPKALITPLKDRNSLKEPKSRIKS